MPSFAQRFRQETLRDSEPTCVSCNKEIRPSARFCPSCGAPIQRPQDKEQNLEPTGSVKNLWLGGIGALIVLVVSIFAGSIGREVVTDLMNHGTDPTSLEFLGAIASEANKVAPMMVDQETELINASPLPGVLVYNYRLVNVTASEIDADYFFKTMRPRDRTQACTTPETADGLLKRGITLRFSYVDKTSEYLGRLDITSTDCNF